MEEGMFWLPNNDGINGGDDVEGDETTKNGETGDNKGNGSTNMGGTSIETQLREFMNMKQELLLDKVMDIVGPDTEHTYCPSTNEHIYVCHAAEMNGIRKIVDVLEGVDLESHFSFQRCKSI
eukprot:gnl/Chilomastix_caulleri/3232.p1 GENE.gnl/Chilomastix_caulleri/3232~~gnl/Chilomastix_caulleri/3232.p1  ORF type:complete len:122 (+),score=42.61 gnl/Chilomastix_caulleri/3232:144-509(+)